VTFIDNVEFRCPEKRGFGVEPFFDHGDTIVKVGLKGGDQKSGEEYDKLLRCIRMKAPGCRPVEETHRKESQEKYSANVEDNFNAGMPGFQRKHRQAEQCGKQNGDENRIVEQVEDSVHLAERRK